MIWYTLSQNKVFFFFCHEENKCSEVKTEEQNFHRLYLKYLDLSFVLDSRSYVVTF